MGLRERKKAQTRQLLADTAAQLFATRGYDEVSMVDVARASDVSDQTIYNYFPAKQDLVFDRAEEFRERYSRTVLERPRGTSPAEALRPLAHQEIERYRHTDLDLSRGEFPAISVSSPSIRRFALEVFDQQVETVAAAIAETDPAIHPAIARAHAASLISVFQLINDHVGRSVLDRASPNAAADALATDADVVLDALDRHFHQLSETALPRG